MARKGYASEYLAKKELQEKYGPQNVIKVAIGGAQDFIVLKDGRIESFIEIKECHRKKYCASEREKDQFERILKLAKEHRCVFELWIHYPKKKKWSYFIYK